jgi:hypothetical protein
VSTEVYLEVGGNRVFASAAGWPGWSRGANDEAGALVALAEYAPRYAKVAKLANIAFPAIATDLKVVERQKGGPSTDFGVPGTPAKAESKPLTKAQTDRMVALVEAAWKYLDQVRDKAPPTLRKGPRGGGRDRDPMFEHVLGAEMEYAKRIGVRLKTPDGKDAAAIKTFRNAIAEGLRKPGPEAKWPAAYMARRTAWHALDHAWEMEDRIP